MSARSADKPPSGTAAEPPTGQRPRWQGAAVRIVFGVIWAIDAQFKWRPGFRHHFLTMIKGAGEGQPSWLHWWFKFWLEAAKVDPPAWAYGIAALETAIAVCLIIGLGRKVAYLVTILTGLGIWSVAEGFGGPYTTSSTDIGTAIIYSLVALALLVLNLEAGPSHFSLDYLIERRFPRWRAFAEVGGSRSG